eukprot:GFYU01027281.1.p1 GENE.GFYU01027281.1~~GFYU01027281.1.p1  ORF type:complete len:475 (-),score=124.85 GFYU01027281.1:138-1562(-)
MLAPCLAHSSVAQRSLRQKVVSLQGGALGLGHTIAAGTRGRTSTVTQTASVRAFSSSTVKFQSAETKQYDITIVGGGGMGSSAAYFLATRLGPSAKIAVVEKDVRYTKASTALSVGSIRQQFSIPENTAMSMFGAQFLKNLPEYLQVDDEVPSVNFIEGGYLFLASAEGEHVLRENHEFQKSVDAHVVLLSPDELKEKYPWMNTDGIVLGSLGLDNEGWFDPYLLLSSFKKKAQSLGVDYIKGNVDGLEVAGSRVTAVGVTSATGNETYRLECDSIINAAGCWSAGIHSMIPNYETPMPVEARKRYVYTFNCDHPEMQNANVPMFIDKTGLYFRREGSAGNFITGKSPNNTAEEPDPACTDEDLSVDYTYFENCLWELLAERVPAFESIKLTGAWAGFYDYNTLDQNAIVGRLPGMDNVYVATGFSGHGIQQVPAVGRALSEIIVGGTYETINLDHFGFERVINGEPQFEKNIV